MAISPLQQVKLGIVSHVHLAKDALHIYVSLIVFLTACLLFRWKARSWKPWLVVLAVALVGETWDIRDSLVYHTRLDLWGNWKDVWNTMLLPTVLLAAARYSRVFARA